MEGGATGTLGPKLPDDEAAESAFELGGEVVELLAESNSPGGDGVGGGLSGGLATL